MADDSGKFAKRSKLLGDSVSLSNELNLSEERRLEIEGQILDRTIKTNAELQKRIGLAAEQEARERQISAEKAKQEKLDDSLVSLSSQLESASKNVVDFGKEQQDLAKQALTDARKIVSEQVRNGDLTQEQADVARASLSQRERELNVLGKANEKAVKYNDMMGSLFDEAQSAGNEFFASLPGGEMLKSMLGFDKIFDTLREGGKAAIGAVVQSLMAGQGPLQALKAGQAAFNATAMMNPYVAIAAALLVVIGLLHQQNKAIREQAEAQGVSLAVAKQQVMAAKEQAAAGQTVLAGAEEILTAQNAINDAMGTSLAINAENAAAVADVGEAMGYGAKAAGESAAAMMQMGVAAADVADIQMETNLAAAKAGVDMGKVQADIAENAGKVSAYFAGNPKALAKAAVEAAKMGMSLNDMAAISDNLLDFEKSISAQFELQALTGKQMNFDKARQLALEGDIAGASAAVLEQVGSIHDFNKMDVLERKKLAEATGMSVEQLQKSLTIQSMRGQLTEEELAAAQGLNLSAAELKNLTADELKQKLASQDATAQMAKTMGEFKEMAMLALQPLFDIVTVLFQVIKPILRIGQLISQVFLAPLKMVGAFVSAILDGLQPIFDIFNEIGNLLGGSGGIGDMFATIGNVIGTLIAVPLKFIAGLIQMILYPIIQGIKFLFDGIAYVIGVIGDAIDTYLLKPLEAALDFLSMLNPANWFGGDDEASVEVSADGEALEAAGSVNDGVIQDGKIISTNPADTLIAVKEPNSLLGGLGEMASTAFSMSPMGMAADALSGLFGGGEDSKSDSSVTMEDVINAISNIEIQLDGKTVSNQVRVADSFVRKS